MKHKWTTHILTVTHTHHRTQTVSQAASSCLIDDLHKTKMNSRKMRRKKLVSQTFLSFAIYQHDHLSSSSVAHFLQTKKFFTMTKLNFDAVCAPFYGYLVGVRCIAQMHRYPNVHVHRTKQSLEISREHRKMVSTFIAVPMNPKPIKDSHDICEAKIHLFH